jgi:hypothetical protein
LDISGNQLQYNFDDLTPLVSSPILFDLVQTEKSEKKDNTLNNVIFFLNRSGMFFSARYIGNSMTFMCTLFHWFCLYYYTAYYVFLQITYSPWLETVVLDNTTTTVSNFVIGHKLAALANAFSHQSLRSLRLANNSVDLSDCRPIDEGYDSY